MRLSLLAIVAGCSFEPRVQTTDAATGDAPAVDAREIDAAPMVCPSRYNEKYSGHSYLAVFDGRPRAMAREDCESDGGSLIEIDDAAESAEVALRIPGIAGGVWIGLADAGAGYVWDDGSPLTFQNWFMTPSAADPDCVALETGDPPGRWTTRDCTDNRFYVCECPGP
jgi:hypothetical protein